MKVILNYRKACEEIGKVFTKKYYPDAICEHDTYWVADEPGSVFCVSDRFFDTNRMIEALELKATYEQLSEYEDAELEAAMKKPSENLTINFKNFVKYGWINKNTDNEE